MKLSLAIGFVAILSQQASAFAPVVANQRQLSLTQQNMFGGGGAGTAPEDDDAATAEIEKAAAAMGMSVSEYQLAMKSRMQLAETMDNTILGAGSKDTVYVERDLNTPPKNLNIIITEEGKALGADAVGSALVKGLKKTAEDARRGRAAAQQKMMQYIQDQLKAN